jgi:thiosulfate/3-mercaptopyruvate sulfurtransferase
MIETFFGLGSLDSAQAHLAALVVGFFFGLCLERAGFGSSRRLAGIFYFRDMAVLKVMFSALITAMIGLLYFMGMGWISPEQIYFMPSVYGAQILGGLLFGVGFVMSGWCPGTGAVGLASGKMDALIFLVGAVVGSVLFNELFPLIKPLYQWGESGIRFAFDALGMSRSWFAFILTCIAVGCFWGAEWIEKTVSDTGDYLSTPFLKSFSAMLIIAAAGLFVLPSVSPSSTAASPGGPGSEKALLASIESAADHMGPMDLADRIMAAEPGLLVVDIRTPDEFSRFHIQGALNLPMSELSAALTPHKNDGIIVLYSNGMTHPAQARDSLARQGFRNVFILTDGLEGFIETCLKPASLREGPVSEEMAARILEWRRVFHAASSGPAGLMAATPGSGEEPGMKLPGLVETEWLASQLGRRGIKILDVRSQPEYNTRHIPGSVYLSVESLRGVVRGVPSMLLPAPMLALHFSQMGIEPGDLVVVAAGDKMQDATLVGMACERLKHRRYAVLNGGFPKWQAEKRPVDAALPAITESRYPAPTVEESFTVDYSRVLQAGRAKDAIILDVRPEDYFTGAKSDEARAGHIPGAINRPYTADVTKKDAVVLFKSTEELAAAYAKLLPSKDARVIVHCRTGHQASQTFFVLKHLLGYTHVFFYDAGWTEWAARLELPIETGASSAR